MNYKGHTSLNKSAHWFAQTLFYIIAIYFVGLTCSTALMELGAALITLIALYLLFTKQVAIKDLCFQGDLFLWLFFAAIVVGGLFISDLTIKQRIEIIRSGRFVFTFYGLLASFLFLSQKSTNSQLDVHENNNFYSLKKLLKILFFALAIVAVYGYVQTLTGIDIFRSQPYTTRAFHADNNFNIFRLKGFYTTTMTYSYLVGPLFCLMAGLTYYVQKNKVQFFENKKILYVLSAIVLISLFLTFTRGLWLALFVGLLAMAILVSWRLSVVIVLATALLFGGLIVTSDLFRKRVMGAIQLDESNLQRLKIWRVHFEMFKAHPLLGVGYEQNGRLMQSFNNKIWGQDWRVTHAHNHFLQILTGTGIFGFLFFMLMSFSFLQLAVKLFYQPLFQPNNIFFVKALALGLLGAQIVFHVGGLSEAVFVDRESNHAYFMLMAILVFLSHSRASQ